MRDPTEVEFEELLGTMLDYLSECIATHGHERWRWLMSPTFFYEMRRTFQSFGNPPAIPYGESNATLWGIPVVVTASVEDAELEEVR